MATIEISGPDSQGQYTVEVESDQDEAQEQAAGGDAAGDDSGSGDSSQGGNSITCGSIREVLQAVKDILQGQGAGGASGSDMWNQEAAKTAAARSQQSQSY